ncbi:MAG: LptA/OstA family protein [Elusimicrobiota bacterium]
MKKVISLLFVFIAAAAAASYAAIDIESSSMDILKKGQVTEFTGNVIITGENYRIKADKAVSYREKNRVEATGNIRVEYSTKTAKLEGWCDKVIINQVEKDINLYRNVKTVYRSRNSNENRRVEILARRAFINYSEGLTAVYEKNVEVKTENTRITADTARYSRKDGVLQFAGNAAQPRAVTETEEFKSVYRGDKLKYYINKGHLEIDGKAHTRIYLDESEM